MNDNEVLQMILSELKDLKQGQQETNQRLYVMQNDIDVLKEDVDSLKKDVETLKEDVEILKEDTAITRTATNTLLEWADKAQVQVQIPLFTK